MVGGHIDIDGEGGASAVPMDRLIKQQDEIGDKTPTDGRTVGPLRVLGEMMTSEWHLLRSCNVVTPAGHHVKTSQCASIHQWKRSANLVRASLINPTNYSPVI